MSRTDVAPVLAPLFEVDPDGLLCKLRADLRHEFPGLATETLPELARDDALRRWDDERLTCPPLSRSEAGHECPDAGTCLPAWTAVRGWLADHAFRFGRVYDGVRQFGEDQVRAVPDSFHDRVRGRLRRRHGYWDDQRIADAIAEGISRALQAAGQYDCGRPIEPWLATIIQREGVNIVRELAREGPADVPEVTEAAVPELPPGVTTRDDWEVILELIREGIEPNQELWEHAAASLRRRGVWNPPRRVVDREIGLLRRLIPDELLKHKSEKIEESADEVPFALFELYVALGQHRDLAQALPPEHPARPTLDDVTAGIESLVSMQERGNWGAKSPEHGEESPVAVLVRIQRSLWGLLDGHRSNEIVRGAGANLHWLSWKLRAAAVLAVAVRAAERLAGSPYLETASHLKTDRSLRTFSRESRARLAAEVERLDPSPSPTPDDGDAVGAWRLLRSSLGFAAGNVSGAAANELARRLPDADFAWWVSRITGLGRDAADRLVLAVAGCAGVVAGDPQLISDRN